MRLKFDMFVVMKRDYKKINFEYDMILGCRLYNYAQLSLCSA